MNPRRLLTLAAVPSLVLAAAVAAGGGAQAAGFTTFQRPLTGAQEVPGPGDPDGSGNAVVQINTATGRICHRLAVTRIATATAAHIHRAPRGVAGPVVLTLTTPRNGSSGCATNPALAREIATNPAGFYVNVHNAQFKAGALRGQL